MDNRGGLKTLVAVGAIAFVLAGCQDVLDTVDNKAEYPLPKKLVNKMKAHDQGVRAPIMMRIFKQEGVLEVWKAKGNGRFSLVKDYEICKWSGELGPKFKEGDRQAPEGFYHIRPHQMNPRSSYYLSFNLGFPNQFDRAHDRTGSNLMVHGACSSAGCYSMTDEHVLEIYAFAREAFRGGQSAFQVQAFPFRMTAENMAEHRNSEHYEFWEMLKVGYDHFELTNRPPKVNVCAGEYVFNRVVEEGETFEAREACPPSTLPESLELAYAAHQEQYQEDYAEALEDVLKKERRASRRAAAAPSLIEPAPLPQSTPAPLTPANQSSPVPTPVLAPVQPIAPVVVDPDTDSVSDTQPAPPPPPVTKAASGKTWWKVWKR